MSVMFDKYLIIRIKNICTYVHMLIYLGIGCVV